MITIVSKRLLKRLFIFVLDKSFRLAVNVPIDHSSCVELQKEIEMTIQDSIGLHFIDTKLPFSPRYHFDETLKADMNLLLLLFVQTYYKETII